MTSAFVHDALFYASDDEFLATTVPFVRAGLDAGETVAASCSASSWRLLRDALGTEHGVVRLPSPGTFRRAVTAIASYRRAVESQLAAGATGVRAIGEVPSGMTEQRASEWGRYEAVLNHALAPYPARGLCVYDRRSLPEQALATGRLTHPHVRTAAGRDVNPAYVDPGAFLRRATPDDPDPLEATRAALVLSVDDLGALRRALRASITELAPGAAAVDDFLVAVHEVAANAVQHGRPPVTARLSATPRRLVCTITDQGAGFDDPFAGYTRPPHEEAARPGLGLWVARHLCDRVTTAVTPQGFTVRLVSERAQP